MKATVTPAYSCKSLTEKSPVNRMHKILLVSVRLFTLAGLFMLSTSYQSHKKEKFLLENDLFLPALKDNLANYFRTTAEAGVNTAENGGLKAIPLLADFYSGQDYKPVWTSNHKISEKAVVLLGLLDNAEVYGLETRLFPVQEIRNELKLMRNPELQKNYLTSRTNLELMLTDACMRFMVYLKMGYREFDSAFFAMPVMAGFSPYLREVLTGDDFEKQLLAVQPDFVEYRKLQLALERFLSSTEKSDALIFLPDPANDPVLFRKTAEKVLINLGYLKPGSDDVAYIASLKKFQYYHGLEPDGKPGKNTREALSQTTGDKYRHIALNLDRLRKDNLQSEQFIYVNIPAYQMRIYKKNKVIGNSKVIVGAVNTPTPRINSKIESIITNPVWLVPRSITLNEMLPKLKSDSGYLSRNRLKLADENRNTIAYDQVDWNTVSAENFGLNLSQESGEDNSLGRVKFVFPNPYLVYLHDTPGKQLFSKDIRAFSHGCVRVQHPEMLADYLVREFSWNKNDVDVMNLINKGIRREITLHDPVDLYIHYITCEADDDLNIYFYDDIYGMDKKELKKLEFLL